MLMVTAWAAGLLPPCWAVKDRLVRLTPMAGGTGAAVTVKETGIVTGVTPVPPVSVTVPLWVPTASEPVAALNVIVLLPVPEVELRANQPAFSLALQFKVPPPVLRILSVCAAGFEPPWVAAKESAGGLMPMAGGTGAGVTVKETGMVTGVAVDPAGQIVTWPLWVPVVMEPVVTLIVTVPVPAPVPGVCDSQVAS